MSSQELPKAIAFAMAYAGRGIGFETGINLALVLVYTRHASFAADGLTGSAAPLSAGVDSRPPAT